MAQPNTSIKVNINDVIKQLKGIEKEVHIGVSRGLNDAAFGLRGMWLDDINTLVDDPTAFTKKVFVKKARPDNLVSKTFIPPLQSEYLNKITEGGVRRPGDYATLSNSVLSPVKARLNKAGNFATGPKRWLATLNTRIKGGGAFVGSPTGASGQGAVYQRLKKGKLKLLAVFADSVEYEQRLDLERTTETFISEADRIIEKNIKRRFV